ncbi:hypothetical protein NC652_019506 [Populus alba x Populus x berolinensis]|nr:hypothetical protein NC652_019506 [Populus alba x Populus x berolinensis]
MDQNLKHRRSSGKCRVLNRSISTSSITNFSFRIISYRLKQICGAYPVKHIIDHLSPDQTLPVSWMELLSRPSTNPRQLMIHIHLW